MKKTKRHILRAALLALVCVLVWQPTASAVVHQGTIGVSVSSSSISLEPGQSKNISVTFSPSSSDQLECCDKADCPETCTKWTMMGATCLDENGQCTCLGTTYETYYASADVSSSDPNVAAASYDGGDTISIQAVSPGTATITVTASLRQFTSSSVTISVTVAQAAEPPKVPETPVTPKPPVEPEEPGTTEPSVTLPYADVGDGDWYYDAAAYMYENGIMTGVTDDAFVPNLTVNRATIVTMLYRLEGTPAAAAPSFPDVAPGQWYTAAVGWASSKGVVTGYDTGNFGPNNSITRQDLALILYRYAQFKGYDVSASANLSAYTDAGSVSAYAQEAMQWAVGAGLITSASTTSLVLNPQGDATRAEIAAMFMRFMENVG